MTLSNCTRVTAPAFPVPSSNLISKKKHEKLSFSSMERDTCDGGDEGTTTTNISKFMTCKISTAHSIQELYQKPVENKNFNCAQNNAKLTS